jgi:hypothetical protein
MSGAWDADDGSGMVTYEFSRLAAVTDSGLAPVALCVARCFVQPQLKRFGYHEKDAALSWLLNMK